jgi:hypothetical protein
MDEYR